MQNMLIFLAASSCSPICVSFAQTVAVVVLVAVAVNHLFRNGLVKKWPRGEATQKWGTGPCGPQFGS